MDSQRRFVVVLHLLVHIDVDSMRTATLSYNKKAVDKTSLLSSTCCKW